MSEEWRPVVGFEGLYEVSDLGRVRSLDRCVPRKTKRSGMTTSWRKGRVLRPGARKDGYQNINIYLDGEVRSTTLHTLVAEAFCGPRPTGHHACHYDGDKSNCAASNLRWGTPVENHQDKVRHGNFGPGEQATSVRLTEADVKAIRARRGERQLDLAAEFGCTFSNISAIQRRKSWAHV